jgi:hypothetical protein
MNILEIYAASGSHSDMLVVAGYLRSHNVKFPDVDHDTAVAVIPHLLSEIGDGRQMTPWYVLSSLIHIDGNKGAFALLDEFQLMPACRRLLEIIADRLQAPDDQAEELFVIKTIAAVVKGARKDDFRVRMVYDTPGLTGHIFRIAAREITKVSAPYYPVQALCSIAHTCADLATAEEGGRDPYVDSFLENDGLDLLAKALYFTAKNPNMFPKHFDGSWGSMLEVISAINELMNLLKDPLVETPERSYTIERNSRFRMMLSLHYIL